MSNFLASFSNYNKGNSKIPDTIKLPSTVAEQFNRQNELFEDAYTKPSAEKDPLILSRLKSLIKEQQDESLKGGNNINKKP